MKSTDRLLLEASTHITRALWALTGIGGEEVLDNVYRPLDKAIEWIAQWRETHGA